MTTATEEQMYELVIRNLDILKTIANESGASNKEYKAQAYQRAIDKIKHNLSQGKKDACKAVAGKSVQERINWIIQHRRDIPEVSEYVQDHEESDDEESEDEEESDEEEETNEFVVKEDISKRRMQKICNTMKSLNTIESLVFNLNLKNALVTNILRDLNKLKEDCREELFL